MGDNNTLRLKEQAVDIHRRAIVIDACAPMLRDLENAHYWQEGGVTCGFATMTGFPGSLRDTTVSIGKWYQEYEEQYRDTIVLATTTEDIRRAKAESKVAVVFHFQSSNPLDYEVSMVNVFHRLGVRAMLLAYNRAEAAADGCMEERDGGLSWFGRQVIREMNRVGMLVDVSHCGRRTSLEAIDVSSKPVAFTHSGAKAIYDHPRNITDEQIRAVAARGGVVGIVGHAMFVKGTEAPTLDDLLDHFDHVTKLAGVDHVGMGFDFSWPPGVEMPAERYQKIHEMGLWREGTFPPPPWHNPVESAAQIPLLTEGLLRRGYGAEDVEKIIGGNFLRLLDEVWS